MHSFFKTLITAVALATGSASAHAKYSFPLAEPTVVSSAYLRDTLGVVVTQSSTYVMPGQEIEISILSNGAVPSRVNKITIRGANVPLSKNGTAVFKTVQGSVGSYVMPVEFSVVDRAGLTHIKIYEVRYTVGQANACVGLDRMNILYVGVDNPVTVFASGAGDDKIAVSISGGGSQISKVGNGRYVVRAASPTDECVLRLFVDEKLVAASQFRVRYLPAPIGTVGGYASGDSVQAGAFKAQTGVGVYLMNFPFELRYDVTGYTLRIEDESGRVRSADCQGAYFSAQAKELMTQYVKPGATVTVGNLFVKDAGRTLKLAPLFYLIK